MNDELKLRQEKPKVSQLKKPLVWLVGLLILLVMGLVVVAAFRQPESVKAKPLAFKANGVAVVDQQLSQLPSAYTDKLALAKYLPAQGIPANIRQELSALQESQTELQQKISGLKQGGSQDQAGAMQDKQAMNSALFFPGSAPEKRAEGLVKTNGLTKALGLKSHRDLSDYEKQNMQGQKLDFLQSNKQDQGDIYNMHKLVKPISPYEVQAGTLIPAVLLTAVNTSLPGEIVARVRENVYDSVTGRYLLIPEGSKLIGQYDSQVSFGQNRVLIVFKRIIRPDGSSILISNEQGSDLFGESGIKGEADNHWGRVIGSAVLSTILSLGAGSIADNTYSNSGTLYRSAAQNAVLSAGNNVSQVGQSIASRAMNVQPTLIIPTGYEFNVIVNKDMVLAPFKPNMGGLIRAGLVGGAYHK